MKLLIVPWTFVYTVRLSLLKHQKIIFN